MEILYKIHTIIEEFEYRVMILFLLSDTDYTIIEFEYRMKQEDILGPGIGYRWYYYFVINVQ